MEACLSPDEFAVCGEGDAALGEDGVEIGEGFEVLVDDGFVEMDPERFGGLEFWGVGVRGTRKPSSGRFSPRTIHQTDAVGHRQRRGVPSGPVEDQEDDAVAPGPRLAGEEREAIVGKTIHWIVF